MEVLLHGRADEDASHIFASLTESELERELHLAERRVRPLSPAPGQSHLQAGYFDSVDPGRLASPLIRCAAAFGPQPLSDQDVDTVRKLVSRMATFAAYRACMPGGLEAVEDIERWQRKVWTAEAEERAEYIRSQPALAAKQQQHNRGHGQQQTSASRATRERPSSSRNKSGSIVSQQASSKKMKASAQRGTGVATATISAHNVSAAMQSGAVMPEGTVYEDSCGVNTESCAHEGTASSYRISSGRAQNSAFSQATVNATAVWNYGEDGSRNTSSTREKLLDGSGSFDDECAWIPEEYRHRSGSTGAVPHSGSGSGGSKHPHDMSAARASLQGALGAEYGGVKSRKQWMLCMGGDSGTGPGNGRSCTLDSSCPPAESLQRAQEAASKEFYGLSRPDADAQRSAVDHPSMLRALQAQSTSIHLLRDPIAPSTQDLISSVLDAAALYRPNEVDTSQWTLESGMPAAVYGRSVTDPSITAHNDEEKRRSTTTSVPSRNKPGSGHSTPTEEVHMHGSHVQAEMDGSVQVDPATASNVSGPRKGANRRRTVSIHTAPACPVAAQQTFGAPRQRFLGAESLSSTQVARSPAELGSDRSPAATAGSVRRSGSSITYQDIDSSPCGAPDPSTSTSPDPHAKHAHMYADLLAKGSHASNRSSACMAYRHERLEPGEFEAAPTLADQTADPSDTGRLGALEPCMSGQEEPSTVDRPGSHGGSKAAKSHSTVTISGNSTAAMHSCLITGAEVQVSKRPASGARAFRAASSRRLHRGRSRTPPAASGAATANEVGANDYPAGPGLGERRGSGRNANHGKQLWQGWRSVARECSSKHTERSASFDDSAAVHVPYIGSRSSGQATQVAPEEKHSSWRDADCGGALQHKSRMVIEQHKQSDESINAGSMHVLHAEHNSHHSTSTGTLALVDSEQISRELSYNGKNSGAQTGTDKNVSAVMRSQIGLLNWLPDITQDIQSTKSLQPQLEIAGSERNNTVPQQHSGTFRENTGTVQGDTDQGSNGVRSGGPGALAPTAVGQMRPRKAGPARGGKKTGRLAGRGGRGPGQPAAPPMLATFEGPALGEMRARLDTVRKLQEDTAAAEAKTGRGRRLRR